MVISIGREPQDKSTARLFAHRGQAFGPYPARQRGASFGVFDMVLALSATSVTGVVIGFGLLVLAQYWIKSVPQPSTTQDKDRLWNPRSIELLARAANVMTVTGCVVIVLSVMTACVGFLNILWSGYVCFHR